MWTRFLAYFKDSETILFARLQVLGAAIIAVLATVDPSLFAAYVPAGWLPIYMLIAGIVTEVARRLRDEDLRRK